MFPAKLKNFNTWVDGVCYATAAQELSLPKIATKMEDYRGGGMNGPVDIDMGTEKLELETTYGGFMAPIFAKFGAAKLDATLLRFAGAYQRDDTGEVDAVEVVVRGRHQEIDSGKAQAGDKTEFKVKTSCSYYKLTVNGKDLVEIDHLNFIYRVGGTDRLAEHRKAIGIG